MAKETISRKTLSILVVVVLVISLLGTFMLLNRKPEVKRIDQVQEVGRMSLTVLPPEQPPQKSTAQGKMTLTVLPQEQPSE